MERRQQRQQEESEEGYEEEEVDKKKEYRGETDGTIDLAACTHSANAAALRSSTSKLFSSNIPVVVVAWGS